jgi:hypothetical protein
MCEALTSVPLSEGGWIYGKRMEVIENDDGVTKLLKAREEGGEMAAGRGGRRTGKWEVGSGKWELEEGGKTHSHSTALHSTTGTADSRGGSREIA